MIEYNLLQIIKSLLLPPGVFILLALLGLLFYRRTVGKFLLISTLISLYLLSTPYVAGELMAGLQIHPVLNSDSIRRDAADAIIVLGGSIYQNAPEYGGDTIDKTMLERIRYTAWLHHRTNLPVIISGGSPTGSQHSEAEVAAKALKQEFWVKNILALEELSRTTWENAVNTKKILEQNHIKKIILVTSAWHMPRALGAFNRVGINPLPAPTAFRPTNLPPNKLRSWLPYIGSLNDSYLALHEHIGTVWYQIRESISNPPADTPPQASGR